MTLILQVFYSIFSGLMLAAAIPNELYLFGCPLISFVAIVPFYISIAYLCKNYKQAFFSFFLQALTTHLCSSFWLVNFKNFAAFTYGGSGLAEALMAAFMGLYLYLPFSRNKKNELDIYSLNLPFYTHTSFRILYFSLIYALWEWVKGSGYLGYPWGTISATMYKFHTFTQLAAITGTYGITFMVVLFNGIVAEAFVLYFKSLKTSRKFEILYEVKNTAVVFALLFTCTLFYGYYQYNIERKPLKKITTIMVQQNCDPWKQNNDNETVLLSQNLTKQQVDELKRNNKTPQLVVWSEGSLQKPFPDSYSHYKKYPKENDFVSFLKSIKTPLITGGSYITYNGETDWIKYYNAAHMFDSEGNYRGSYAKLHLVPFAESIPGIDNPKIKAIMMKLVGISAGWSQGRQLTYFDVPCSYYDEEYIPAIKNIDISIPYKTQKEAAKNPTVRISTPICFDDSFTDVIRPLYLNGAELFVNITDDSWSLTKSSEIQHFVIASYRAIEYRTTLLRSTNAGYSVVLDPAGKIIADEPLFQEYATSCDVPIYARRMTTYARCGNWLPYFSIIVLFITAFLMYQSFTITDYIPSERKFKKHKKHHKKHTKKK